MKFNLLNANIWKYFSFQCIYNIFLKIIFHLYNFSFKYIFILESFIYICVVNHIGIAIQKSDAKTTTH